MDWKYDLVLRPARPAPAVLNMPLTDTFNAALHSRNVFDNFGGKRQEQKSDIFIPRSMPKRREAALMRTVLPNEWPISSMHAFNQDLGPGSYGEDDDETAALNEEIRRDPALWNLMREIAPGVRERSKYRPGLLATKEERMTNIRSANLHLEAARLRVDGTDSLHYSIPRKQNLSDDPFFAVPDREFGETDSRTRSEARKKALERQHVKLQMERKRELQSAANEAVLRELNGTAVRVRKTAKAR